MNDKQLGNALMPYLQEMAKEEQLLEAALKKANKSLEECAQYVIYQLTDGKATTLIADGNEVMEIARRYYLDDTIVMPRLTAPKVETKVETKAEVKPIAKPKSMPNTKSKPKTDNKTATMFDMFADM